MTVKSRQRTASPRPVRLEIFASAPTEFFHCQHWEVVWHRIGLGQRWRAEQRGAEQPPDLQEEYAEISDWILDASERYGDRLLVTLVDPASLGGFWKALHHRVRRFPSFVVDGRERIGGFEHERLDMCRVPFGTSMRSNSRPTGCMSGGPPHTPKLCSEPSGKRQSGAWLPTGGRSPAVPAKPRLLLLPVLAPVAR